jgi:hypothetical protein
MVEDEKDAAVRGGAQAEARFQACADRCREAAAHGAQLSWLTGSLGLRKRQDKRRNSSCDRIRRRLFYPK